MAVSPDRLLSNARPDLYAELHSEINSKNDIHTELLTASSETKVWWRCLTNETHYWKTTVLQRAKRGTNCAMCSNQYIVHGINDLSVVRPELYSQLAFNKNEEDCIDIEVLSPGSDKKVWWKCVRNETHIWQSQVYSRSGLKSHGCPICTNKQVISGVNDLSVSSPKLYDQLHATKNLEHNINTEVLSISSAKKVWWQCNINPTHYWLASPDSRSGKKQSGCAMCNGKYVVHGINDLSALKPKIYSRLNFKKNEEENIDIKCLSPNTHKKVWWKCDKSDSHSWLAAVYSTNSNNTKCSMCSNHSVVHGINDLSVSNPELYSQLHPELNKDSGIDTTILSSGSSKKVWWKCNKNSEHYWAAIVYSRSGDGSTGCAMCNGKYVVHGVNDLSVSNPVLYSQLHPERNKNAGIDITILSAGSPKKVWWKCDKISEHYWSATVSIRNGKRKDGCAMCANRYVVHGINDLSVSTPPLYSQLHPELNKGSGIDTTILSEGSDKKVWWKCNTSDEHYWLARVSRRLSHGCAMCSSQYVVHGVNDLSAIRPEIYSQLHFSKNKEAGLDVFNLATRSAKKVWWKCNKVAEHYWFAQISSRTSKDATGCAMCSSQYIIHGVNDLSVFYPDLYQELHKTKNFENKIDILALSPNNGNKVWWQCKNNIEHYWESTVNSRSGNSKTGCPHCVTYRNESEFRHLFSTLTTLSFANGHITGERELFKGDKIQIDMINRENKVIIEYDGWFSHGGNDLYKTTAEGCLARDVDTTATLLREGYRVIRIRETPLKHIPTKHQNLFQVHFKDREDKLLVIEKCVKALQKMDIEIEIAKL